MSENKAQILPSNQVTKHVFELAILKDKPILLDYWKVMKMDSMDLFLN
jgi:hypothetical protein